MRFPAVLFLASVVVISGCAKRFSQDEFKTMSAVIRESPSMRAKLMTMCRSGVQGKLSQRWADETGEKGSKAIHLACQRLIAALANGRISYETYQETQYGKLTPELIDVLKGR